MVITAYEPSLRLTSYQPEPGFVPACEATNRLDLLTRRCTRCETVKTWREFPARTYWPDGEVRTPQSICRVCKSRSDVQWQRRNRAAVHPVKMRWHRRRRSAIRAEREGLQLVPTVTVRGLVLGAVSDGRITWVELAHRVGTDESSLHRMVVRQKRMGYSTAVAVVRELGADPVEMGL
jgi:hypothetical protein